ncbi:HlyC/CorC family transporter [bacterium CPR1]|nr:HlyC/CorC family transporter [bacterium CPR1]
MEVTVGLLVIAGLVLLNSLFVAAEFSLVGVPQARLAQMSESGSRGATDVLALLKDKDRLNRFVATAQVGLALVILGLGMYGEPLLSGWFRQAMPNTAGLATVLALLVLTCPHVVLGQVVPKALALTYAVPTSITLQGPLSLLERLFFPVVVTLNAAGNSLLKLLGAHALDPKGRLFSPEELEQVVEESHQGGLLERTEEQFLKNIFDFQGRIVGRVMTARTRVFGLSVEADRDEVLGAIHEHRYTRYPVYEGDMDHLVGVLHIKDLARQMVQDYPYDLRALLRPVLYVPASTPLEDMVNRFRTGRTQFAVVLDEFGGMAGVVTVEDVVEEVVGEIQDEFDQEMPPLERLDDETVRVRGDLMLTDLRREFGGEIPEHPEVETVGGMVMAELGRVPESGDRVRYAGLDFEVEEVTGMAVQSLLVRRERE